MAPPVNGTTVPTGAPVPVAVEGGGRVAFVTGIGYGAVADEGTTGVAEDGAKEVGVDDDDDDDDDDDRDGTTIVEEGTTGAGVLEETATGTV